MDEKDRKVLYKCDPKKNADCSRMLCQTKCFYTTKAEYSIDGIEYDPDELLAKQNNAA